MSTVEFIFWAESIVLALVILLWAATHLRDEGIRHGWIPPDTWIARNAAAAERSKLLRVLKEIGFREEDFQALARSRDGVQLKRRYSRDTPLSRRLLFELKRWTVKLDEGFCYGSSGQYYIDTMGAMSFAGPGTTPLAALLDEWVRKLVAEKIIPPFNIVLVLKDGNVTMARQFLTYSPSERIGILCKGAKDRSRVSRGDLEEPHQTDFEGLRTLLGRADQPPFNLNAIAVDDNCAGGSSLCYAMRSFNRLIQVKGYPINPVEHAVVVFNVKSDKTEDNFQHEGLRLHAILSLGHDEMAELLGHEPKDIAIEKFKSGFGCGSSRELKV